MLALLLTALFSADPMPLDPTTGNMMIGQMGILPTTYTYRVYRFVPPGNPPDPMNTGYAEIDVLDDKGKIVGTLLIKGNEELKNAKGGMVIKMPGTFKVQGIIGITRNRDGINLPMKAPLLLPVVPK